MSPTNANLAAITWVLLSTFIWTLIYAAAKFADGQIGVFQISLCRYVGALVILLALLPMQGGLRAHRSWQPVVHLARALCGCGGAVAITWASANMPLIDASAIGLLNGVLMILLGATFLNERIRLGHGCAIGLALTGAGIIVISKGAFQSGVAIGPAFVAFCSALLFALEGLLIRVLGQAERALTVMLYVTFFGCCLMVLPAALEWQPFTPREAFLCAVLGPFSLVGQYCTIRGYRLAPLSVVAPVDYAWLPFSMLVGLVVFNEVPGPGSWLGSLVILASGALMLGRITWRDRNTH